jgi:hypothetical protein
VCKVLVRIPNKDIDGYFFHTLFILYMDNGINHILNVEGILKNFSIAKKISSVELREIKSKASKECASKEDYMELLKREIIRYTDDYVKKNKIPGLIVKKKDGLKNFTIKDPVYIKLYKEASLLAKNLTKGRNLEKRELIFLIMSLVGALELTQDDFNKFNREINKNPGVEETEKWGGFGEFDVDDDDDDDDDDDEIV